MMKKYPSITASQFFSLLAKLLYKTGCSRRGINSPTMVKAALHFGVF